MSVCIHALFCFLTFRRCFIIKDFLTNEEIRAKELRVIDADGSQLGVISTKDALAIAEGKELDLVVISPNAEPPVAKIVDFGKFKFEQMKKDKEAKKNQKVVVIKEIRLSPNIEKHDMDVKASQSIKFLQAGNKLKIVIRFSGRELAHKEIGQRILDSFLESISEHSKIDKPAVFEGKQMIIMVSPKN